MSMTMFWSKADLLEPDGPEKNDLIGSSAHIAYVDCFALNFFVDDDLMVDVPITKHELEMHSLQKHKTSSWFITMGVCL